MQKKTVGVSPRLKHSKTLSKTIRGGVKTTSSHIMACELSNLDPFKSCCHGFCCGKLHLLVERMASWPRQKQSTVAYRCKSFLVLLLAGTIWYHLINESFSIIFQLSVFITKWIHLWENGLQFEFKKSL